MWPVTSPVRCRVSLNRDPTVGDMVVFLSEDGRVWVHRVEGKDAQFLYTRGDTQAQPDRPVPREAVLGRVDQLALGPIRLPCPERGPLAWSQRLLGIGWSQIAPRLRIAYRHLRKV